MDLCYVVVGYLRLWYCTICETMEMEEPLKYFFSSFLYTENRLFREDINKTIESQKSPYQILHLRFNDYVISSFVTSTRSNFLHLTTICEKWWPIIETSSWWKRYVMFFVWRYFLQVLLVLNDNLWMETWLRNKKLTLTFNLDGFPPAFIFYETNSNTG